MATNPEQEAQRLTVVFWLRHPERKAKEGISIKKKKQYEDSSETSGNRHGRAPREQSRLEHACYSSVRALAKCVLFESNQNKTSKTDAIWMLEVNRHAQGQTLYKKMHETLHHKLAYSKDGTECRKKMKEDASQACMLNDLHYKKKKTLVPL